MVCAWAWRLVETRAYPPMRIRHLLWHRPHRPVAVGPRHRPAHQQLVGLVPTAVAVAVGAALAADSPGGRHPVLLQQRQPDQQMVAPPPADATSPTATAPIACSRICQL